MNSAPGRERARRVGLATVWGRRARPGASGRTGERGRALGPDRDTLGPRRPGIVV
jgi:hypothetical protein